MSCQRRILWIAGDLLLQLLDFRRISRLLQQKPLFAGQPELRVNPAHAEMIEHHIGTQLSLNGWRLVPDPQLHAGGCRVVADDGEIDMSVATRWQELCRLYAPETLS